MPWDDPVNDKVGNILLSRMMGADSRLDPHGFDIGIRDSWKEALREVEESGGTPYPIPAGASEHPLGGVGFANYAFELAEQEKALGVHFDTIVVCTVTCSTHAGMVAGFAALEDLTGVRRRVIGIDASATLDTTRAQLERIARHTAEVIELGRDLRDDEFTLLPDWAGDLYGVPVDSTMEAMRLGAELEAMITDPVYEGKSLAGLIDLVRTRRHPQGLDRALRPPRRPARAQRLPLAVAGLVSSPDAVTPPVALVRRPGPRLAEGLVTHIDRTPVDLDLARAQWQAYVDALDRRRLAGRRGRARRRPPRRGLRRGPGRRAR